MMIGSFTNGTTAVTNFFSKPVEQFIAGPGQERHIARLSIATQIKAS
jgi:hypothetical protein